MLDNKIILHVGSHLDDFTGKGKLLTSYQDVEPGEYWTTFVDSGKITDKVAPLYEILKCADTIIYNSDAKWSDQETKDITEYFLMLVDTDKHNVRGLVIDSNLHKYLRLFNQRQTIEPCVFSAGCSITYGTGVKKSQRFSNIISKRLNKELVNLSYPATALEVQADQILRSDIKKDDIVIWGLTHELRESEWENDLRYRPYDEKSFSETNIYSSITSVYQVVNFCKKISARLILLPILCSESFQKSLVNLTEYIQLPYQVKYLDLGSDNKHPGPKQHQYWADLIWEKCFAKKA